LANAGNDFRQGKLDLEFELSARVVGVTMVTPVRSTQLRKR